MNYLSYDDPGEDLRGYGGARNWDSALGFLGGVLEQSDYWHMERWGTAAPRRPAAVTTQSGCAAALAARRRSAD